VELFTPPLRSLSVFIVSVIAVDGLACSSASLTSNGPSAIKCGVTATTSQGTVSAGGGAVAVRVAAAPECAWTVSKDAPSIGTVSPSTGQGNGEVTVEVMPNPAPTLRQTALKVNSESVTLRQEAAACQVSVAPPTQALGPTGGPLAITVTASAGCGWTAASNVTWIVLTSQASGSGTAEVTFTVTIKLHPRLIIDRSLDGLNEGDNHGRHIVAICDRPLQTLDQLR
jgi:hypothetical protein